jgi:hypothetical protein
LSFKNDNTTPVALDSEKPESARVDSGILLWRMAGVLLTPFLQRVPTKVLLGRPASFENPETVVSINADRPKKANVAKGVLNFGCFLLRPLQQLVRFLAIYYMAQRRDGVPTRRSGMVFPIAQHSANRSNRFANCVIVLVAGLTLTATHASDWRCVDASGHTYNSSQRVPSDTCQEMSTGAAYEAPPDAPKDPLVAAPVKSAKTPPLKRAIKAKPRRSGASIGMSKEER